MPSPYIRVGISLGRKINGQEVYIGRRSATVAKKLEGDTQGLRRVFDSKQLEKIKLEYA